LEVAFVLLHSGQPGEIIASTALIRCIKNQVEGAEIFSVVREDVAWLLSANPYISDLFTFTKTPEELATHLRDLLPDYLIDLHGGREVRRFKNRLKVLDFTIRNSKSPETWLEHAFATCQLFDVQDDGLGKQLFAGEQYIDLLPGSFHNGYLVLSLDRDPVTQSVSDESIIEMVVMTEKPMVITGPAKYRSLADRIGQSTGCAVFPTCGDLNPEEILSILKHSNGVISMNVLGGELADALKVPVKIMNEPLDGDVTKNIALWGRSQFHPNHGRNSA
jgi:hypothetical protein